jgi:hypothetical protein
MTDVESLIRPRYADQRGYKGGIATTRYESRDNRAYLYTGALACRAVQTRMLFPKTEEGENSLLQIHSHFVPFHEMRMHLAWLQRGTVEQFPITTWPVLVARDKPSCKSAMSVK